MRLMLSSVVNTLLATALIITSAIDLAAATGTPLSQHEAASRLHFYGIVPRARGGGGCIDPRNPACVSYHGILSGTVDGIIDLKLRSRQHPLFITGGTEVGHPQFSQFSHSNGHVVSIQRGANLDMLIRSYPRFSDRADGRPQWRAPDGRSLYTDEGPQWEVTFV